MEHQYLSDATGRLTNPDLWGATAELEIQELARGTNQEIQMKLGELTSSLPQRFLLVGIESDLEASGLSSK